MPLHRFPAAGREDAGKDEFGFSVRAACPPDGEAVPVPHNTVHDLTRKPCQRLGPCHARESRRVDDEADFGGNAPCFLGRKEGGEEKQGEGGKGLTHTPILA
ncbi:MAG: hypothetical protein MdMp014T_2247 [Treponematales bacterium]